MLAEEEDEEEASDLISFQSLNILIPMLGIFMEFGPHRMFWHAHGLYI